MRAIDYLKDMKKILETVSVIDSDGKKVIHEGGIYILSEYIDVSIKILTGSR